MLVVPLASKFVDLVIKRKKKTTRNLRVRLVQEPFENQLFWGSIRGGNKLEPRLQKNSDEHPLHVYIGIIPRRLTQIIAVVFLRITIYLSLLFILFNAAEFPVAITAFTITSDWGSIETEGPLHCVLDVQGFPSQPFSSGTFQHAFKASCVVANKYLELGTQYVLKQQKVDGNFSETDIESLSTESIDAMDAECQKKSAKVK